MNMSNSTRLYPYMEYIVLLSTEHLRALWVNKMLV